MKHSIFFIFLMLLISCEDFNDVNLKSKSVNSNGHSGMVFPDELPLPNGFQPEGIAIGPNHSFYVGSLMSGQIYMGDLRTGEGEIFIAPPGPFQAVGLAIDKRNNYLFVAGGFTGTGSVYNCATGDHVQTYAFAPPGSALINDVTVTRDAVYFTNSLSPVLYKIPLGKTGELPDPGQLISLPLTGDFSMVPNPMIPKLGAFSNGIDATPLGKELIIANTDRGELYVVDPGTGVSSLIDLGGVLLPFADGISLEGKTLYVVQNLMNQISVIALSDDYLSGTIEKVIQDPKFGVPTTIDRFGSHLYAVNAHFDMAPPPGIYPDVEFEVVRVEK